MIKHNTLRTYRRKLSQKLYNYDHNVEKWGAHGEREPLTEVEPFTGGEGKPPEAENI